MARTANVAICNGTNARIMQGEKVIHAHYTSNTYAADWHQRSR